MSRHYYPEGARVWEETRGDDISSITIRIDLDRAAEEYGLTFERAKKIMGEYTIYDWVEQVEEHMLDALSEEAEKTYGILWWQKIKRGE